MSEAGVSDVSDGSGLAVRAAVLVPVQLRRDGDHVVTLTRRSMRVSNHPGQVAFPGGRFEAGLDESLIAAALREAHEEVGLPPGEVRVLGALPECRTLSGNFVIHPFVGVVPDGFPFRPSPDEVESVFGVRMSRLGRERTMARREFRGQVVQVPALLVDGVEVWGATLQIIDELRVALHRLLGEA